MLTISSTIYNFIAELDDTQLLASVSQINLTQQKLKFNEYST